MVTFSPDVADDSLRGRGRSFVTFFFFVFFLEDAEKLKRNEESVYGDGARIQATTFSSVTRGVSASQLLRALLLHAQKYVHFLVNKNTTECNRLEHHETELMNSPTYSGSLPMMPCLCCSAFSGSACFRDFLTRLRKLKAERCSGSGIYYFF